MTTRLDNLRQLMEQETLDGFLATQPENRRYLSSFSGSNGALIITPTRQVIATDFRYYEQVRQECPGWELAEVGYDFAGKMLELLRELELGGRRVGFEAAHTSVTTLLAWEQALQGRLVLVHTEGLVEQLRQQKDTTEIASLRKAIAVAEAAFEHVLAWLKPGLTERQAAWELESYMRTHGASDVSFEVIVASGPNAARPHARPTDRLLQPGEPIIFDFGCIVDGYCSDLTRTVCLGEPADDTYLAVWRKVLEAQQAALEGAKAGLTGQAIDKLARDIIVQAGYGDNFGHALGHGVGLAVHENPRFSFYYPEEIPAGAVVTVEPGIYLPEWGGVRLEDMVLIRPEGVEILTQAPKQALKPE